LREARRQATGGLNTPDVGSNGSRNNNATTKERERKEERGPDPADLSFAVLFPPREDEKESRRVLGEKIHNFRRRKVAGRVVSRNLLKYIRLTNESEKQIAMGGGFTEREKRSYRKKKKKISYPK